MGIRMPGATSGLFDPKIVEQLIEVERGAIDTAVKRKEKVIEEKKEIESLQGLLNDLDASLNSLKTNIFLIRYQEASRRQGKTSPE